MKKKVEKEYIYWGLGFPIVMSNVPMIEVRGTWTPDINYQALQKIVLLGLSHKSGPLTGAEVSFIRKFFGLTCQKFGKLFGVSHAAVLKWEKHSQENASIQIMTEKAIRLYILDHLLESAKEFRNAYRKILDQQMKLTKTK